MIGRSRRMRRVREVGGRWEGEEEACRDRKMYNLKVKSRSRKEGRRMSGRSRRRRRNMDRRKG